MSYPCWSPFFSLHSTGKRPRTSLPGGFIGKREAKSLGKILPVLLSTFQRLNLFEEIVLGLLREGGGKELAWPTSNLQDEETEFPLVWAGEGGRIWGRVGRHSGLKHFELRN
jgi:hypothetical protein